MGYLIRVKSNAEKSLVCAHLRKKGLSQMVTPFRTRGESMNTVCIFAGHFYCAHWDQVDAFMEGEEMLQITIKQYESKCTFQNQ